jgi:hypothetical protein
VKAVVPELFHSGRQAKAFYVYDSASVTRLVTGVADRVIGRQTEVQ